MSLNDPFTDPDFSYNTDPSTPAENNNNPPSYSSISAMESEIKACQAQVSESIDCCNNPLSCVSGSDKKTSSDLQTMQLLGGTLSGAVSAGKSRTEICKIYKNVSYAMAAANTAVAGICGKKKSQCNDVCGGVKEEIKNLISQCQASGNKASCGGELKRMNASLNSQINKCNSLSDQIILSGLEATNNVGAGQAAAMCEEASKGDYANAMKEPTLTPLEGLNTDCNNPFNASNPICRFDCKRPGAQNDPLCQNFYTNSPTDQKEKIDFENKRNGEGSTATDVGLRLEDEGGGDLFHQNIKPQSSNTLAVGSRGGGGPSLGGGTTGGSGGPGQSGKANRSKSTGYDTNILKGARNQSGYSRNYRSARNSNRNRIGYGSRRRAKISQEKLDLKQFLPGGTKAPKRGLASILSPQQREIAPRHTEIWKRISDRYQEYCRMGVLEGCSGKNKDGYSLFSLPLQ